MSLKTRQIWDLKLLVNGAFSPLRGFLGKVDYERVSQEIEPVQIDGDRQVFDIPVDGGGDSPYALQSVWEFRVSIGHGPIPVGDTYRGYWTASASVYKQPPSLT